MNQKIQPLTLSFEERRAIQILIVEPHPDERQKLRDAIDTLNFGGISWQPDHVKAVDSIKERRFTHLIFTAKITTMPAREFLVQALTYEPEMIALPSSSDPNIDEVFDLLRLGARGFVIKPYSAETIEQAIIQATRGEAFSDAILNAANRNEAFAALAVATLDKLATATRQAERYSTARAEVPRLRLDFESAMKLGLNFAEGGEAAFRDSLVEFFIKLADGPASRLGRLRQRLKTRRRVVGEDEYEDAEVELE